MSFKAFRDMGGLKYWKYRQVNKFRPWLATKLPAWLVTDALIHAGVQKIRDNETVPEVPFMLVYERWYKEGRN